MTLPVDIVFFWDASNIRLCYHFEIKESGIKSHSHDWPISNNPIDIRKEHFACRELFVDAVIRTYKKKGIEDVTFDFKHFYKHG